MFKTSGIFKFYKPYGGVILIFFSMKKFYLFIGLAVFCLNVSAQEAKVFAPQAGDFSISVNAAPFLNYVGNIFGSHATAPAFNEGVIRGRYFLSERNAIRVSLNFDFYTDISRSFESETGNPDNEVTNITRAATNSFGLSVGYEFRRGTGRLQAFYGAEVGLGFSGGRTNNTWGNELSAENPQTWRTTQVRPGLGFDVGLGGFVGVEYFITPRIAVGAEVGLSLVYENRGRMATDQERWFNNAIETRTLEGMSSSGEFLFSTNTMSGGGIFLSFFF